MFEKLVPTEAEAAALFDADTRALYPCVFAELAPAIWALCMGAISRDQHNDAYTNTVVNAALVAAVQLAIVGGATPDEIIKCATTNAELMDGHRAQARTVMDASSTIGNKLIVQLVERNVSAGLENVVLALDAMSEGLKQIERTVVVAGGVMCALPAFNFPTVLLGAGLLLLLPPRI